MRTRTLLMALSGLLAVVLAAGGWWATRAPQTAFERTMAQAEAGASSAPASPGGATSASGIDWVKAEKDCQQPGANPYGPLYAMCISDLWSAAVDARALPEVAVVFNDAVQRDPIVDRVCHTPAHEAGRHGLESGRDMSDLLAATGGSACGGGYVHGLMEAFSEVGNPLEDLAEVAQACNALTDEADRFNCGHGIGHAGWISGGQVLAGVLPCNYLDPSLQRTCAEGVVMSAYGGKSLASNRPDVLSDQSLLPGICASLADAGFFKPVVDGCYSGAGAVYVDAPAAEIGGQLRQRYGANTNVVPLGLPIEAVAQQWQDGIDRCSGVGPGDASELCSRSAAAASMLYLAEFPEDQKTLCEMLDETWVGYCLGVLPLGADPAPDSGQAVMGDGQFAAVWSSAPRVTKPQA